MLCGHLHGKESKKDGLYVYIELIHFAVQKKLTPPRKATIAVQSLNSAWLFMTPWTAACQASLSFITFHSLLKFMSIESAMPSNHLILCHPLLLLPSIFPSIRVFSNELALCIRWPKYWSFSFNIGPSSEYSGLVSFRIDWLVPLDSVKRVKSHLCQLGRLERI